MIQLVEVELIYNICFHRNLISMKTDYIALEHKK